MTMKQAMAHELARLRKRCGYSQAGFAREMGVTRCAVHWWENGKNSPKIDDLPRIARALGVTTVRLVSMACRLAGVQ